MNREYTKDIIPLEEGLYELARKQINRDSDFLALVKVDKIDQVDKVLFDTYRDYKFVKTVNYAYNNSRFYKRLYDENNVDLSQIKSIKDIIKLPFTTPNDLAISSQTDEFICLDKKEQDKVVGVNKCQYDFLCTSQAKVERAITFATSGTVGPKKRIFFSQNDIDIMTDFMAVGMNTVMDDKGVTQIFLPPGPQMGQADLLSRGVKKMKGSFIVTGMLVDSRTQIETIIKEKTTVIFGETRLMYRITKEMEEVYDLPSLGLKTIFVTTSYLSDTMRQYLEKAWNARVTTHYGLVEMGLGVAVECGRGCGYHYDELDIIAETVDPITGQTKKDREIGEMVFTSISRDVMPIIRYKNKDLSFMDKSNNKCRGLEIIGPIHTRIEAMVQLGKDKIYPTYLDNKLFKIKNLLDYEVHLHSQDGKNIIAILVETVKLGQNISSEVLEIVKQDKLIKSNMSSIKEIKVEYAEKGTMKSETHFKKVIGDYR